MARRRPSWPDDKGFLGKPADTETGLTHVGAREYDPLIGRFLSADPILSADDHESINGYAYANNTPSPCPTPPVCGRSRTASAGAATARAAPTGTTWGGRRGVDSGA
ncbi:RHS repeat-associated core domain-containing protein [Streptomyces sp. R41]|uniref:RHS repeat-associated core domain-containing protein n=1 Tax=Streptomyces sp. R41 TaxID=3238632 RepID=A0AB39RV52_9ACTN